jgi:hypothetical protein
MDTIENTEAPAGDEGATSSLDTASQVDTQPSETEPIVSDEKTVEEEKALLAGKYKTPEELEKGYKELESKLGRRDEHSELVKMLEEQSGMSPSQIKDYIAKQKAQALQAQYQANPELYTAQKIQELEGKIALQAEERELDKFLEKNPGYSPHREKILKLGLNLEKDKTYDEIAREYFGEARAQGQQDAYKKIETKNMTQATSASQAAPKSRLTEEDMDKMSAAELEAVLPWADVSHRL